MKSNGFVVKWDTTAVSSIEDVDLPEAVLEAIKTTVLDTAAGGHIYEASDMFDNGEFTLVQQMKAGDAQRIGSGKKSVEFIFPIHVDPANTTGAKWTFDAIVISDGGGKMNRDSNALVMRTIKYKVSGNIAITAETV